MSGKPRSNAIPWTAFLLGAGASIAANVAHAAERNADGTDIGAMLFAAWAPVALLLVAEMMVRGQRPRGLLTVVEWVGAFLVALAAAVVSYGHMRGLLLQYGESELVAVLLPLSVDGLVVVASVALAAGRRNKAEQRNEERTERTEQRTEERTEQRTEQRTEEWTERKEQQTEERKTEERKAEERKAEERTERKEQRTERKVRVPVVEVESSATIPVTVTPPHSAERRSAVEWAAEQLRSGATLTGAEIGARYGRTDRWGRNVLRDARQQLAAAVPA
ncbi:DUF2637 domain-containing protein [Algoriphagus aestuarii]|nr:DUF2637 domain-containing protein [Algoriphagus aestuarii]